jgi:hypothetical protein
MKINKHIVLVTVTIVGALHMGFMCSKADEAQETLEESVEGFEVTEQVTILTQKGGSAEIIGGSCSEPNAPADAVIANDYPGADSAYVGGELHTYNCDPDVAITETRAYGRLGGVVCKNEDVIDLIDQLPLDISASFSLDWNVTTQEGAVGGTNILAEAVPGDLECIPGLLLDFKLPAVCPWMASFRYLNGELADPSVMDPSNDYMDMSLDPRNNPPQNVTAYPASSFVYDCANVLRIDEVSMRFDWESPLLLIGDGLYEGATGGIYSNFHFTVVPWMQEYDDLNQDIEDYLAAVTQTSDYESAGAVAAKVNELMNCYTNPASCDATATTAYQSWQTLMRLAENVLLNPDEIALLPQQHAEALLPGAFWTKDTAEGSQCEWLDTVLLSSSQITDFDIEYHNFGIWDWDIQSGDPDPCVAVILWEGDGSQTSFYQGNKIGPNDMADDFVGYFKLCKNSLDGGAESYYNYSDDLYIVFSNAASIDGVNCP